MTQREYCQMLSLFDQKEAETEKWFREAMSQMDSKYFYLLWCAIWCGIALGEAFLLFVVLFAH